MLGLWARDVKEGSGTPLDACGDDNYGLSRLYGQRVAMRENGTRYFFVNDHLGSPVTVLNASGAVVSQLKYYAYGRIRSQSAPPAPTSCSPRQMRARRAPARGLQDDGAVRDEGALARPENATERRQ
jgi:hypothetical protein